MKVKNNSYKTIIIAYKDYLKTLGYADTTVRDYTNFVRDFFIYAEQNGLSTLQQITNQFLFEYFDYLEQRPHKRITNETLSTAHLNRVFGAIDKFLEFLHQIGMDEAPEPPKHHIKHERKKPLIVLNTEEIQELYKTIPLTFLDFTFATRIPRQMVIRLVLDLCYGCGLRRSEMQNIQLKDVDFDRRLIYVKQGKNYKDRYVPMSQKVYENIQDFIYNYRTAIPSKRPLYLYPYKETAFIFKVLLRQSSRELQTKKPTLHTLRHSIATHLLQNGMSIENISQFLGHSGLSSTQIYTHIINDL